MSWIRVGDIITFETFSPAGYAARTVAGRAITSFDLRKRKS